MGFTHLAVKLGPGSAVREFFAWLCLALILVIEFAHPLEGQRFELVNAFVTLGTGIKHRLRIMGDDQAQFVPLDFTQNSSLADALGLDRIYVQAKRYADNKVSAGDIRDFFGSLDRFKASKGLFVTTSSFSPAAKETADLLSKRIVLIDGNLLTRLMIRYDIGCRVEETIQIKKVDEEFFD